MPSYRVTMSMGLLRPGVAPQSVLARASDGAAQFAIVEASDIAVVAGEARLTIRFAADDAELAPQIGQFIASTTDALIEVVRWRMTQRSGNRWIPLSSS